MRYHSLDFWRGIACLMVVVVHSTIYAAEDGYEWVIRPAKYGWLGVPMFFVISGYCIAAAADACVRKDNSALTFFKRRFRRIYPPFLIALAIFALLVGGVELAMPTFFADSNHPIPPPWSLDVWQLAGNLSLTETWRERLVGSPSLFFMYHAWTLCYEEQFYAVLGLGIAIAPKRLFEFSAVISLAVVVLLATGVAVRFWGTFLAGPWLQFAAGILVFRSINYRGKALAVGLLLVALAWQWSNLSMAVSFGFAALLIVLHPWDRIISGNSLLRPVRWCGTICYSLYLVHWPLCKAISHAAWLLGLRSDVVTLTVTVPLCLAASVAAGHWFHVFVERRFLNAPISSPAT